MRFAPSPTGPLHVGNAYVALFDYVFARATRGKFVLRIEDTDRERSTRESEQTIMRGLKWLGLQWDEGPDVGGPFGPYRQSERADVYREKAEELLKKGRAYRCFCTPEQLAHMRRERQAGQRSGYDGTCRKLPADEAEARAAAGEKHVLRLAVPREGTTTYHDTIRGDIAFKNEEIDDQVLVKSDGFPTYHLANVVDDRLMQITHVIRAEEWLSSTPKHVLLYDAFGWRPPVWVHMPLLRNPDKSKLSKRKNPTSIDWYRDQGYLPQALLNFLALLGWSMPDERDVFSIEEMAEAFSWDRVSTGGPIFDLQKLDWMNGVYIRALKPEELVSLLQRTVLEGRDLDDEAVLRTMPIVQERMKKLNDFVEVTDFLFRDQVSPEIEELIPKKRNAEETAAILDRAAHALRQVEPWAAEPMEARFRTFVEEIAWKTREFFMAMRVAITGRAVSPPLFESMEILGRAKSLERLENAIRQLTNAP